MYNRLSFVFAESVEGCAEGKWQSGCRQTDEVSRKATSSARNAAWAA
ncbi:MAG: hypothetical protein SPI30_07755 [Prevotella sp.]|nr:hypothetical protein [Prevotella sp.]